MIDKKILPLQLWRGIMFILVALRLSLEPREMCVLPLHNISLGKTEGVAIVIVLVSLEVKGPCSSVPHCNYRANVKWEQSLKRKV